MLKSIPLPDHPTIQFIKETLPFLNMSKGPWVAGGCLRKVMDGSPQNHSDIDVFFPNNRMLLWAVILFDANLKASELFDVDEEYPSKKRIIWKKERKGSSINYRVNCIDQTWDIQFVTVSYHKSVDNLLASFDFRACMWATDGKSMVHEELADHDVKHKLINVMSPPKSPKPHRLAKYILDGYTPTPSTMALMLGARDMPYKWYDNGINFSGELDY